MIKTRTYQRNTQNVTKDRVAIFTESKAYNPECFLAFLKADEGRRMPTKADEGRDSEVKKYLGFKTSGNTMLLVCTRNRMCFVCVLKLFATNSQNTQGRNTTEGGTGNKEILGQES